MLGQRTHADKINDQAGDNFDKKGRLDLHNIHLSLYYFRNLSSLSIFGCCFKKSTEELKEKAIIDLGMTKLKNDLNFQNLLDRIKMSQHETVQLHEKKIINYDEFEFNEPVKIPALYFNKEY